MIKYYLKQIWKINKVSLSLLFVIFLLSCLSRFDFGLQTSYHELFVYLTISLFAVVAYIVSQIYCTYKYVNNKFKHNKIYFNLYILFFVFYPLFSMFGILYVLFIFSFTLAALKTPSFFLRYFFALACAVADIGIKLYLAQGSVINALFYFNKVYYDNYYYLIALCFALIQLSIEAYYFYQKEKPKWIRYNRLKLYKNTQIKN